MSFFKRIAAALFHAPVRQAVEAEPKVTPNQAFAPIDSNAGTVDWFNADAQVAGRDSIDSNPTTARWYRRRRYVVPGAASHRTSGSFGGE